MSLAKETLTFASLDGLLYVSSEQQDYGEKKFYCDDSVGQLRLS